MEYISKMKKVYEGRAKKERQGEGKDIELVEVVSRHTCHVGKKKDDANGDWTLGKGRLQVGQV